MEFDYSLAFSRNIGVISEEEQARLRNAKVGVAGLGAAGGATFHALLRTGIGRFHIADLDAYEMVNFNRQIGARVSTVGRSKVEVMEEMAKDINPLVEVKTFPKGINEESVDDFLAGVDVVVDGIDYFSFSARQLLYSRAREKGIPVVVAAPLIFTTSWLVFTPESMPWDDYFAFDLAKDDEEKAISFFVGLCPSLTPARYVDLSRVRFDLGQGPSFATAIQVCAGVNASEAVKLIIGRGKVYPSPYCQEFDTYLWRYKRTFLRGGNRSLWQRLKVGYIKKILEKARRRM